MTSSTGLLGKLRTMGLRGTLLVSLAGVVAVLALLLSTREWGVGRAADGSPRWKYLLEDVSDRSVYQQRGAWLPTGLTPYTEVHSEYPQLATWFFGVPYLFFDSEVQPGVLPTVARLKAENEPYGRVWQVLMALVLGGLLLATALCLRELSRSPAWVLLFFLPGPLYFTFSRFDVLPSLLVMIALLLQLRGRRVGAAVMLALGAMMKWYPALLLPLFLAYNLHATDAPGADAPPGARRDGWRARLLGAVIRPGLAAGLVVLAVLVVNYAWRGGGLPAVLHHYEWHLKRPPNAGSLVFAMSAPGRWEWVAQESVPTLIRVLTLVQFLPAILLALLPVRSRGALLLGCLTVVLAFTLFTKDFSPQWIVWIAPLAILLAADSWPCRLLLPVLAVMVYVQMPLLYYERLQPGGTLVESAAFWAASDTRIALLGLFFAWSATAFVRSVRRDRRAAATRPDMAPAT